MVSLKGNTVFLTDILINTTIRSGPHSQMTRWIQTTTLFLFTSEGIKNPDSLKEF